jgi:hypothetical protein
MNWMTAIIVAIIAPLALLVAANRLGMARLRAKARNQASRPGAFGSASASVQPDLIELTPPDAATDIPAVLLVHAWGVPDPAAYRALILHLLNRGLCVRFPLYQHGFFPHEIAPHILAILDARSPDWRRDTLMMIGHSAGGTALVDILLGESDLAATDVFLASAADGNGPDGKPLGSSLALLKWGRVVPGVAVPARERPMVHIVSTKSDQIAGSYTSDQIANFLENAGWGSHLERISIPDDVNSATHFWPTGGNPDYRLSTMTQRFAYTDAYGGVEPGKITESHRFLFDLIDQAIRSPRRCLGHYSMQSSLHSQREDHA